MERSAASTCEKCGKTLPAQGEESADDVCSAAVSREQTERVDWLLNNVGGELHGALSRFAAFNSPHEGKAVIEEELDELWDHVKANTARGESAMDEAIQVAAMALRYVYDLAEWGPGYVG